MEFLAPLGPFDILRVAAAACLTLYLPGRLFLEIHPYGTRRRQARDAPAAAALAEGAVERFALSVFLSVLISSVAYAALTFTVGLNALSAALGMAAVNAAEGFVLWKRKKA